jgi:phosphoglycerate kinase
MKPLKFLKNLSGKRVLLRVDLNSNVINGKVAESDRIRAHSETIKFLLKEKAKVVVIAHQGSPGERDFISLKQHAKLMNKYVRVKFVRDIIGKKAIKEIKNLKYGEAILLENIRFLKEEFKPEKKNRLVKNLAPWFDLYVNDAFSICHRNQTSIVSFPKVLPHAIGFVMGEELRNIKRLKSKMRNCLFILGGKKTKDVLSLIRNKKILTTGKLSLLALKAQGYRLGKEDELLKDDSPLIPLIKENMSHLKVPVDLAISDDGRKDIPIEHFPKRYPVWDIGKKTIEIYKKEIKKLKKNQAIFFKGSTGVFEYVEFDLGTKEILKAIANSKAFSVIAGGQSTDALNKFHIDKKKFDYVSLSGGALIKYLAGEKLVGLEVLR